MDKLKVKDSFVRWQINERSKTTGARFLNVDDAKKVRTIESFIKLLLGINARKLVLTCSISEEKKIVLKQRVVLLS